MKPVLHGLACAGIVLAAQAGTTIDEANKFAWAANLGWTNWRDAGEDGAVIGESVCSGCIWSANCGWIHLGDGSPGNGIQYSNASATDYGVNVQDAYSSGGVTKVKLRGFAYGANIGWINFESQGNPEVSLPTGRLSGFAWSANCGWLDLGEDTTWFVRTSTILPGGDSDGDGLADAFELMYCGDLAALSATGDRDADGRSDLEEYIANTNPTSARSALRLAEPAISGQEVTLTWVSSPARLYRIATSTDLLPAPWDILLDGIVPDGDSTTRAVTFSAAAARFFRVEAYLPP